MRLIIGGAYQGKQRYLEQAYHITPDQCATDFTKAMQCPAFVALHEAVKRSLSEGRDPLAELEAVLSVNPNIILVCDEVGCGVVPIQREERAWREAVGRLCCTVATHAESVERVFCGIAVRLK